MQKNQIMVFAYRLRSNHQIKIIINNTLLKINKKVNIKTTFCMIKKIKLTTTPRKCRYYLVR